MPDSPDLFSPSEKKPPFVPKDKIDSGEQGWISPKGIFYPCLPDEHNKSAEYLVGDNSPDKTYLSEKGAYAWTNEKQSARQKLENAGYVLVNGSEFRTNDYHKLSAFQIALIQNAGIHIFDARDKTEYPPFVRKFARKMALENIAPVFTSPSYLKDKQIVDRFFEISHLDPNMLPKEGELNKFGSQMGGFWIPDIPLTTYFSLQDFLKKPFDTTIKRDWDYSEGDSYPLEIYNHLSHGYQSQISYSENQDKIRFRVLKTPSPDLFVYVFYQHHSHNGAYGGYGGYFKINYALMSRQEISHWPEYNGAQHHIEHSGNLTVFQQFLSASSKDK
jgi:hypothetical protein